MKKFRGHGHSLIELVVVIAIVTVVVSISIPALSFFEGQKLREEVETLHLALHYLSALSRASNSQLQASFDNKNNSYQYQGSNAKKIVHKLPPELCFGFLENTKGPPGNPREPVKDEITFYNHKVIFMPDGKISPGTIYIKSKDNRYMQAVTCPVANISYIRKYYYDKNEWKLIK